MQFTNDSIAVIGVLVLGWLFTVIWAVIERNGRKDSEEYNAGNLSAKDDAVKKSEKLVNERDKALAELVDVKGDKTRFERYYHEKLEEVKELDHRLNNMTETAEIRAKEIEKLTDRVNELKIWEASGEDLSRINKDLNDELAERKRQMTLLENDLDECKSARGELGNQLFKEEKWKLEYHQQLVEAQKLIEELQAKPLNAKKGKATPKGQVKDY